MHDQPELWCVWAVPSCSVVSDSFVTARTVAHQPPPSMGILQARMLELIAIPRLGDLPNPRMEPRSPVLQAEILYCLNHRRSPRILEWAAHPFSRGTSQPRNRTGVSGIAGGFFPSWAAKEALQCLNIQLISRCWLSAHCVAGIQQSERHTRSRSSWSLQSREEDTVTSTVQYIWWIGFIFASLYSLYSSCLGDVCPCRQ